jgi:hypothetical protein
VETVPVPKETQKRPKGDLHYPKAVKRAKDAALRLQAAGIIDSQGRRIHQDIPADMQEGQDRDVGG